MNKRSCKERLQYLMSLATKFNSKELCIKINNYILYNIILFSYLSISCNELQNKFLYTYIQRHGDTLIILLILHLHVNIRLYDYIKMGYNDLDDTHTSA